MRLLVRLTILGLAGYGAKALYDRYASSQSVAVSTPPGTSSPAKAEPTPATAGAHAPGRVDPNSPAAQADDAVAVAMATPPKLS